MIDRPKDGERAILVQIALPDQNANEALAEFEQLATSANAEVVGHILGARSIPDAKYYVGLGKAQEIHEQVLSLKADLVLVNHELSPSQERNLERLLQCRVVDRSGLILDIFAKRARTFEGKLQVELAQLQHLSTRLVRGWTHLERQKGGIGLRGPGETQLETDRRLLQKRIKSIHNSLEKVQANREQNRRARRKSGVLTISLVGYTNAGKSQLFNALTGADIYSADQLFATLDPLMHKLPLPGSAQVILVDTVGFIRNLPHHLIEAFQATLEETAQADLLLHVIDLSDPNWREMKASVEAVFNSIGVAADLPVIEVMNKIDQQPNLQPKMDRHFKRVWLSAKTGVGLDYLREALTARLFGELMTEVVELDMTEAKLRSQLYQLKAVVHEEAREEGGWRLSVRISSDQKRKLFARHKDDLVNQQSCMRCYVTGKVQGVCFRATAKEQADELGLYGWARNLPDGRVEIVACGDPQALEHFDAWLRHGPRQAQVSKYSREELPGQDHYQEFVVL